MTARRMTAFVFDLTDEQGRRAARSVLLALIDRAGLPQFEDDELRTVDDDTQPVHPDELRRPDDRSKP